MKNFDEVNDVMHDLLNGHYTKNSRCVFSWGDEEKVEQDHATSERF